MVLMPVAKLAHGMASMMVVIYLLAVIGVVMMWRGIWGLLDEYLLPKNPKVSCWISFIVGFLLILAILLTMA